MPHYDVRCDYLPFCLKKQPDGRYVILNANHNPVGFSTVRQINWADHPVLVNIYGLTSAVAAQLSCTGSDDTEVIFLYDSECLPVHCSTCMDAYTKRLAVLALLQTEPPDEYEFRLKADAKP